VIDLHRHVLAGVDDGANVLARRAARCGPLLLGLLHSTRSMRSFGLPSRFWHSTTSARRFTGRDR
jgi:hypothetical protein